DTTKNAGADAFVAKLSPDGSTLLYSTFLGGGSGSATGDTATGIALGNTGAVYVAGSTYSPNFPVTAGAFDTTSNGDADAFVSKLDPTLSSLAYSTYIGGTSLDAANQVAVDGSGNAYISGYGTSTNYPTTAGAFDTSFAGD